MLSGATNLSFLFADGSTIFCCDHETLNIVNEFSAHKYKILLLAIDKDDSSESGRMVASFDQNRRLYVSYLDSAAIREGFDFPYIMTALEWTDDHDLICGDIKGNLTLISRSSMHRTSLKTDKPAEITALASKSRANSQLVAIGYRCGALKVVEKRQTTLTFLIKISGSCPIRTMTWNSVSQSQQAEMLAVQSSGGVRCVSLNHSEVTELPSTSRSPFYAYSWMAWSSAGRIMQYSAANLHFWDPLTGDNVSLPFVSPRDVKSMAIDPAKKNLYVLYLDKTILKYELSSSPTPINESRLLNFVLR
ncbi:hypothetical protein PWT90_07465 [Aphanocladium album]|nr:hypothetical protein PWT90_07465 [Aphanocladium album]